MPFPPCPRCGTSEASLAVAAVVASGTRYTEGTQWNVGAIWTDDDAIPVTMGGASSSVEQSDLARMLEFPEPPASLPLAGCLAVVIAVAGLVLAGAAALLVFVGRTILTVDATLTTSDTTGATVMAALTALVILAATAFVVWLLVQVERSEGGRRAAVRAKWEHAAPVAARLIYCARDHIVYDPAVDGRWIQPAQTRTYAFERGAIERGR